MTKEELKEKIEAYEEIINDPSEDQTTRDFAAKKVAKLKDQIAPGYAALTDTSDDEEIEIEEMEEEEVEEVVEDKPKKATKKKKTTKKKGRGRPKKRGRPAKRKATKKAAPTKAKVKKMSKDLGLSVKECEELLEKYNNEDKARKSRLAKRKKAGKSAELSVSESLEKEVKTVKNKVEDKKTPTTKAQAKSQGSKITDLVKAILEGIDKKKDKITQIDAIIKGLVAEKKKIMAKKGTGAFLVGSALGGYAGYKIGLSQDKTALKDLFKGEKKLAKDFKDAVKDKKKKDETYTEFEEIYAKGGKITEIEYTTQRGDREFYETYIPSKELKRGENEKELIEEYYGEVLYQDDMGWWIDDDTVVTAVRKVDPTTGMGNPFLYAKGGKTQGYDDTEDESLGMRTGKESSKKQDYKARREDSYGKWGKRDKERVSKKMLEKAAKETGAPMEALKDYAKAKGLTDKNLVEEAFSHYVGTYNSDEEMVEENDLYHHLDDNMMVNPKLYGIYGTNSYFTEFSKEEYNYKKGGKTPKFKVRKSFYDKTLGANEKTGTGEDMRSVYHLQMDGESVSQNYLLDPYTTSEEYLKENRPPGNPKGFEVEEEVYVDFTDKDGKKRKGYMIVNNPDLAVRILRDRYNAVSIEDMTMEWEMDDKGKDYDDYTDSY